MIRRNPNLFRLQRAACSRRFFRFCPVPPNLKTVRLRGGHFSKEHAAIRPAQLKLFPNISLEIGHPAQERWAVVGPAGAGKTTLLEIIRGRHVGSRKDARTYPALNALAKTRGLPVNPLALISYVGAPQRDGQLARVAGQGAYLSARFESGREASDLTLTDYLTGNVHLNPDEHELKQIAKLRGSHFFGQLVDKFRLANLADQPLSSLSNGQTRRARIARALVSQPGLLLLDEPFVGLDPLTQDMFKRLIHHLSDSASLCIVCAFEDADEIPEFITHIAYINKEHRIVAAGLREDVVRRVQSKGYQLHLSLSEKSVNQASRKTEQNVWDVRANTPTAWYLQGDAPVCQVDSYPAAPAVVEMSGVRVRYGEKTALGGWLQEADGGTRPGLWWTVRQGERWGVFGPNGAGKTTLLALISSDHPQAYSEPLRVFGRTRLPSAGQPGLPIFDLQARIGQASPEIHNFFPRNLTVRQTLESAWAETFRSPPRLTHESDQVVEATLRWFHLFLDPSLSQPGAEPPAVETMQKYDQADAYVATDVDWADNVHFYDLDFSGQRVALFLRAVIRKPDLVILDEAFGGMSTGARLACMTWLAYGERRRLKMTKSGVKKSPSGLEKHDIAPQYRKSPRAVQIEGLEPRQTLLCVAHRREDVPPILSHWIMLPPDGGRVPGTEMPRKGIDSREVGGREVGTTDGDHISEPRALRDESETAIPNGVPPRFGRFEFPGGQWLNGNWWNRMWLGN